jgi:peptidoglycan/LPS O-acetylase OafA/YrhL
MIGQRWSLAKVQSVTIPESTISGSGRIESIQILRFAAAFFVVAFHLSQLQFDLLNPPFRIGAAGVDVFFVISGFIIGYSSGAVSGASEFLRRRIIRIVPIYWVLTIALFVIASAMPSLLRSPPSSLDELLKSLLFIPYARTNGIVQPVLFLGWTLNYEMFFYVSFALAMCITRYAVLALSVSFLALVSLGFLVKPTNPVFAFYADGIILEFLLGLWIYEAYIRWPHAFERLAPVAVIGLVALLAQNYIDPPCRELSKGIPSALILIGMIALPVPNNQTMKLIVMLGDASYSIYLIHPYIIQVVLKLLQPASALSILFAFTLILFLVFLLSVLSFQLFEKPVGRLLNRRFNTSRRSEPVRNMSLP